jgi:hypothetical protein
MVNFLNLFLLYWYKIFLAQNVTLWSHYTNLTQDLNWIILFSIEVTNELQSILQRALLLRCKTVNAFNKRIFAEKKKKQAIIHQV